jgi:hypothetical protein
MRRSLHGLLLLATLTLGGCGVEMITACAPVDDLVPICGVQNPEDMLVLPDGRHVLISQYGQLDGHQGGGFAIYDALESTITQLPLKTETSDERWGAADCGSFPGEKFSPHGIDLSRRSDGRWQILAANHGGREAVEWFELLDNGAVTSRYRIEWRGCVLAPTDALINSVAALPNEAGFVASQLWKSKDPGTQWSAALNMVKAKIGMASGALLHWDGKSIGVIPGTAGTQPNGLVMARDGKSFYVNMDSSEQVEHYALEGGAPLAVVSVPGGLDNMRWSADGNTLLVASIRAPMRKFMHCLGKLGGACPALAAIVEVDPQSMTARELFVHEGAPMATFTVAVELQDSYLLGSFASDRILKVPKSRTRLH